MGRWLEHSVTTEIQAPADRVWTVWADLEAMPRWMRWIESVVTLDDPDLTDWTLAAQGFRFHWKARITQRVEAQQLHWESVGAAHQGGRALLPPGPGRHHREAHGELRAARGTCPADGSQHPGGIVTKELQANLDRFRDLVESGYGKG